MRHSFDESSSCFCFSLADPGCNAMIVIFVVTLMKKLYTKFFVLVQSLTTRPMLAYRHHTYTLVGA